MKIIIPTNDKKGLEANIADHFGRCNTYTVLDDSGKIEAIINNTSEHMGGVGLPPELMKKHGADILLCRELGPRALSLCKQLGISVYTTKSQNVKQAFLLWKNNKLNKAKNVDVCQEHRI